MDSCRIFSIKVYGSKEREDGPIPQLLRDSYSRSRYTDELLADWMFSNEDASSQSTNDEVFSLKPEDNCQVQVLREGPYKLQQFCHGTDNEQPAAANTVKTPPVYQRRIPYLSSVMRQILCNSTDVSAWNMNSLLDWSGTLLHQDFDEHELSALYASPHLMAKVSQHLSEKQIDDIVKVAIRRGLLPGRKGKDIKRFLNDANDNKVNQIPLAFRIKMPRGSVLSSTTSLQRNREFGFSSGALSEKMLQSSLKISVYGSFGPSLSFTGTSGDVGTLAWAPNSNTFAAGSICLVDDENMQYNRENNLLVGNIRKQSLQELPDHYLIRQKPYSGVNSTHSMHASQDSRLFQTVSMVDFSSNGNILFSVGYDHMLRAWDMAPDENVTLLSKYHHSAKIDLLTVKKVGCHDGHVVATGSQTVDESIAVVQCVGSQFEVISKLSSPRAQKNSERRLYPSCLKWARGAHWNSLLLGGFATASGHSLHTYGDVCVWKVDTPNMPIPVSQSIRGVFDCTWDLHSGSFAVGCMAGTKVNRGCRSVVKVFSPDSLTRWNMRAELECSALDMNDVVWSPFDSHVIAAACTDSKVYVWDIRKPDNYLHILEHDRPLIELGEEPTKQGELLDTGVRFSSWGESRSRFYSGSSDGVVKSWDLSRAKEDVFVTDTVSLHSGIMSGAFSPDFTSLLLGEVNGSITLLEVGRSDRTLRDMRPFCVEASSQQASQSVADGLEQPSESGIAASRELLTTNQIILRPMGPFPVQQAVQGPRYDGSGMFDCSRDAHVLREASEYFQQRIASMLGEIATYSHCQLPRCIYASKMSLHALDVSDSFRSYDRIPHTLRLTIHERATNAVDFAKGKCNLCKRTARPGTTDGGKMLCEYCDFACFRCNQKASLQPLSDTITCAHCNITWRIDVLGYKIISRPVESRSNRIPVFSEVEGGHMTITTHLEDAEMNACDDYYFAF